MYLEFRRQTRAGMKQMMLAPVRLYERTTRFHIYEHHVIPGLFQTIGYARAMLKYWFDFLETHNDIDAAVAARMARQSVLYEAGRTFAVILEEAVLYTRFGSGETLAIQLDHLLSIMDLPNVSIGIVPRTAERDVVGQVSFWVFDSRVVSLETPTASIEVTTPQEVIMYVHTFDQIRRAAIYGQDARDLILRSLSELSARD
jgi:hypothetical protein